MGWRVTWREIGRAGGRFRHNAPIEGVQTWVLTCHSFTHNRAPLLGPALETMLVQGSPPLREKEKSCIITMGGETSGGTGGGDELQIEGWSGTGGGRHAVIHGFGLE